LRTGSVTKESMSERRIVMNRGLTLIGGLGLGVGLMYLLDPDRGRGRRARLRQKMVHALHKTDEAMGMVARDLSHRGQGLLAELRSLLHPHAVPDQVLVERVRSKLGRAVSHPGALGVTATNGRITLTGSVPAHEVKCLLNCVSSIAGVTGVEDRLEVRHNGNGSHRKQMTQPALHAEPRQVNWPPAARLLAGTAGGALVAYSTTCRAPTACILGTVGLGLMARAFTNRELTRLVGLGSGRRLIDIQKTINVAAPVERVFEFWSRYEDFPRFMAHVRAVKPEVGTTRSHWVVAGPAGVSITWDTVITQFVPNQIVAWETVPGSLVAHAGSVRFEPNPDGGTRLTVRMSYHPPGGALGHVVATLFGSDPKHALTEDLMRLKSLIEQGKTSAHGEQIQRKDVVGAVMDRGFPRNNRRH
jgi:uncharacterized membrane protein